VLDVRPVHVSSGEFKIGFDRLAGVARGCGRSARRPRSSCCDADARSMALSVAFPVFRPFSRSRFLDSALRNRRVLFKDVLDAEEDVAEADLPHQSGEPLAVVGDSRGHRLNGVFEVVQPGVDNRPAERLEPPHVERDVVVHDEERPGAMSGPASVWADRRTRRCMDRSLSCTDPT